jgi:riboflavin synthase
MFTGIIEDMGTVTALQREGSNLHITVQSAMSHELKIDQSLSHNGVCLTVIALGDGTHTVTAIDETLRKTNIGDLAIGTKVNLERAMPASGRFDGHIVQGHVDTTGVCTLVREHNGSWEYRFSFQPQDSHLVVEKGSICINGVSLTVVDALDNELSVAIIPYTYEHTGFHQLRVGHKVNLEFDIVGKYLARLYHSRH